MCCKLIYIIMCMIMAFNGVIYMMRETGRLLLGIQARARFAAYSVFGHKTDCAAETIKNRDSYILKSPDGALEVTVSGGKLTYSAAVGGIAVIESSEIGLLIQGGRNIGADVTLGEPKIESCEETYRDLDTETDITDRHMNYIIPVRAGKIIYSLEVRIWNDGFGFRLLFDEETGLLISDELTQFNVPGDTVCRYQTDLKKMQGKTLTQKTSELSQSEVFSCMTAFEFPGKHIYNDNRIGHRELPRHGSAFARRGQIQNGAVGHGQVLYKRRESSVAHSHRVPLARSAHSLPRYNPRRSARE